MTPIKWPKKKYRLTRNGRVARPQINRPTAKVYWDILRAAGQNLCVCVLCGNGKGITVHHRDGNPHNNKVENLMVLCWNCHRAIHDPALQGIPEEQKAGIKYDESGILEDSSALDDPVVRQFYGILDDLDGVIQEKKNPRGGITEDDEGEENIW